MKNITLKYTEDKIIEWKSIKDCQFCGNYERCSLPTNEPKRLISVKTCSGFNYKDNPITKEFDTRQELINFLGA